MTIYVSHSTSYDYLNDLYIPIRASELNNTHKFILPHETTLKQYKTKELFVSGKCDLVIAECSYPSIGQGIELGWADFYKIPIVCFYKKGVRPSGSLQAVTNKFIEYKNNYDLITRLQEFVI